MTDVTNIRATAQAGLRTGTRFIEIAPVAVIIVNKRAKAKQRPQERRVVDCRRKLRPRKARAASE